MTNQGVMPREDWGVDPSQGQHEHETDPFRALLIREDDESEENSDSDDDEQSNESHTSSSEEDEFPDPPDPVPRKFRRNPPNEPKNILGITIASLNMRGRQKNNKDKMKMAIDWLRINKITILALQETHLMEEAINNLNEKYRALKFYGSGLSTSSGGIMFIVNEQTDIPQHIQFEEIEKGRTGMLSFGYGDSGLNIVNVYMPNHKTPQKETLKHLRDELRTKRHILEEELIILGDWNFVEDRIDRSPQHDNDRGVTSEMTKLKSSLNLIDGWRTSNPEARGFTWEGTTGTDRRKIFSRIDRIYTTARTWDITNEYKIINCDFSDHDGISVTVRDTSAPNTGKGERKLNINILNYPSFQEEADRLLNKLENQLNRYEKRARTKCSPEHSTNLRKLRAQANPQTIWNKYKENILRASTRATQKRRTEITKLHRKAERNIKKAERDLRHSTPENEERHRKPLSDNKKTLNDYEEEGRNNRTNLTEAKWFKDSEMVSKSWFGLNKSRAANTAIKSLFKENGGNETKDPLEMLEIARSYHSKLQRELTMNTTRERAIESILANMRETLDEKGNTEMGKETTYKEVYEVLKRAPNGKAPGPDGIPNEFWKTEINWRNNEKEEENRTKWYRR